MLDPRTVLDHEAELIMHRDMFETELENHYKELDAVKATLKKFEMAISLCVAAGDLQEKRLKDAKALVETFFNLPK